MAFTVVSPKKSLRLPADVAVTYRTLPTEMDPTNVSIILARNNETLGLVG